MARQATPRPGNRKRRSDELIVSLAEFAKLCGVTPKTMQHHLAEASADAPWLLQRGGAGQEYRIELETGGAWFHAKRAASARPADNPEELAALRRQLLGEGAAVADLTMPGKRRYEEYRAAEAALAYRQALGELVPAGEMQDATSDAVVRLRQALMGLGGEVCRQFGLAREVEDWIYDRLAKRMTEFVASLDQDLPN